MSTTRHTRSIHVDAPVEAVFDYVKDPHSQYAAFPQEMTVSDQRLTHGMGEGSTWKVKGHLLFIPVSGTVTRRECTPYERIVDQSSQSVVTTFTVEPDSTGTVLTILYEFSTKVPLLDKIGDRLEWSGERDLDTWLGNFKAAIETGSADRRAGHGEDLGGAATAAVVVALPPDAWSTIGPWMTRAFQDEPMYQATFPSSHRRLDAMEAHMRWIYRMSLLGGAVMECTPDLDAVAVWEPPGQKYSVMSFVRAAPQLVAWMRLADRGDVRRVFGQSARWDRRRRDLVPEPNWRLALLGVNPDRQRSGLGTLLIRHGIARADAMGAPVYTETGTQDKADLLCERLGFEVVEQTMEAEQHFPVWRLLRMPSSDPSTSGRQ